MVAFKNALIIVTLAGHVLGAPVLVARQGAGVGQGCDAIAADADTSTGQVVKQGGAWLAKNLQGANTKGSGLRRRQGAGVGQGCDALFSNADTSTGQVVKQGGAYLGNVLKGANTQPAAAPAVPAALRKRQLDKMGAGAASVIEAIPGTGNAGEEEASETSTVDGNATNGSAMMGEAIGDAELNMGNAITETAFGTTDGEGTSSSSGGAPPPPPAGKGKPKRSVALEKKQLDKMGSGIASVIEAVPNTGNLGEEEDSEANTVDGDGTNGSAMLGEGLGEAELDMGNAVTETAFGTTDGEGSVSS